MGAAEYVKDLAEFVKKFNDIELNRRILKLEEEVIDLTREKRRAEERVEELERSVKFKGELVVRDGLYWAGEDGPFCTACWDAERKAIRLKRLPLPVHHHRLQCPHCETLYSQRTVS